MSLAFARYVVAPGISLDGPSRFLQKPIIRLVGQGPAWVATFIILSGFVNALRPIKLARAGQVDSALANLATSAFRRSFRLFLPALVATVCSWFICQLGAYETARNSDAFWIAVTSPRKSASWSMAIDDLVKAVRDTWMFDPNNAYDQPQWALLYLLMGSMICFSSLLMFVNLTPMWRVLCVTTAWCWGWNWDIRMGSRMSPLLRQRSITDFDSLCRCWHFHRHPPRRTTPLRNPDTSFEVLPDLCATTYLHRPNPHVLSGRVSERRGLVPLPPQAPLQDLPSVRLRGPHLAYYGRRSPLLYRDNVTTSPSPAFSTAIAMAREDILSTLSPPRLLHEEHTFLAPVRQIQIGRIPGAERRSALHRNEIPITRQRNLLRCLPNFLPGLVHGRSSLGDEAGTPVRHYYEGD